MIKKIKDDDNRTIADMNVVGFKWYISDKEKANIKNIAELKITRKERKAMILGAYKMILPIIALFILGFGILFILMYLWLN